MNNSSVVEVWNWNLYLPTRETRKWDFQLIPSYMSPVVWFFSYRNARQHQPMSCHKRRPILCRPMATGQLKMSKRITPALLAFHLVTHRTPDGRFYINQECSFVQKLDCYCLSIENFYRIVSIPCTYLGSLEIASNTNEKYRLLESFGVPFDPGYNTEENLARLFNACPPNEYQECYWPTEFEQNKPCGRSFNF